MLRTLVETLEADTMIQRDVERQHTADSLAGQTKGRRIQEFGGIEGIQESSRGVRVGGQMRQGGDRRKGCWNTECRVTTAW